MSYTLAKVSILHFHLSLCQLLIHFSQSLRDACSRYETGIPVTLNEQDRNILKILYIFCIQVLTEDYQKLFPFLSAKLT